MKTLHKTLKHIFPALLLSLAFAVPAQAAPSWKAGAVGDFANADNWEDVSSSWNVHTLIGSGTAYVNSNIATDPYGEIRIGMDGNKGALYIGASGTFTALMLNPGSGHDGGDIYIGQSGDGEMVMEGGKAVTNYFYVGPNSQQWSALLTMSGDAFLEVYDSFYNGYYGKGVITLFDDARISVGYSLSINNNSIWAFGLSAARGGGSGTDAVAFVSLQGGETYLRGTLNLLSDALAPMDDFTVLLMENINHNLFTYEFDAVTVDGLAVANWSGANGVYTFDNLDGNQHYTLNYGSSEIRLSVLVDPVPEPGTWAMLAGGLGVLALLRRRRG